MPAYPSALPACNAKRRSAATKRPVCRPWNAPASCALQRPEPPFSPIRRIAFVYTPKRASWLNQIELWFSILVRRLLKRASFTGVEQLNNRVLAFIDYFNKTMGKPFKGTYTGCET